MNTFSKEYINTTWFFNKEPIKCYYCSKKLLYIPSYVRDKINSVQSRYLAYEKDINNVTYYVCEDCDLPNPKESGF